MTLDIHTAAAVARITIDRPDKRNAIDPDTRVKLGEALAALDRDDAVRAVVLTGRGSAFCTGTDLSAAAAAGTPRLRLVDPFETFSKPLIAAINGQALAGGLEIALCCDIRIASHDATFGLPEVRIGSLPGSGGTQRLPLVVGPSLAAQMILTGQPITAGQALAAGLVSELCEADQLMVRADDFAATIAANAPLSTRAAKRALRAVGGEALTAGLELERTLFEQLLDTEDRAEGRLAFRERRKPIFKGK